MKFFIFLGIGVVWLIGSSIFSSQYDELQKSFNEKSTDVSEFVQLEKMWGKKAQKDELKLIENMLNVQDVKFTKKMKKTKHSYEMQLNYEQLNSVFNYVISRNVDFIKFKLEKIDAHNAKFSFEIQGS